MSCEVISISPEAIVEMLVSRANAIANWDLIGSWVGLMKELVQASKRDDLNPSQRETIGSLSQRAEERALELAEKETDQIGIDWRNGSERPGGLKYQILVYRDLADKASTRSLDHGLRVCANRIQEFLNQGSEDLAERLLRDLEYNLSEAKELLAKGDELKAISSYLVRANCCVNDLSTVIHVNTVGLPRVAKKRNVDPGQLLDESRRLIKDASDALAVLKAKAEEERRVGAELGRKVSTEAKAQAEELRRKVLAEAKAEQAQKKLEREVQVIERRNAKAGQAARQFLEHARLGNAGGAKSCLDLIRRHDHGIPVVFQEKYGELLRKKKP